MENLRFDNFESARYSKRDICVLLSYDIERFILFRISDEHNVANDYRSIYLLLVLELLWFAYYEDNGQRIHREHIILSF